MFSGVFFSQRRQFVECRKYWHNYSADDIKVFLSWSVRVRCHHLIIIIILHSTKWRTNQTTSVQDGGSISRTSIISKSEQKMTFICRRSEDKPNSDVNMTSTPTVDRCCHVEYDIRKRDESAVRWRPFNLISERVNDRLKCPDVDRGYRTSRVAGLALTRTRLPVVLSWARRNQQMK